MRIGCVVMASGEGKRFAAAAGVPGNKLLAPLTDEPLVVHTVRSVPEPFEVVVSTRWTAVADALRPLGVRVALHEGHLRSDSVRAGLLAGADAWDGCLFLPGDQPLVGKESFRALARAFEADSSAPVRLAWQGASASPVLFPRRLFARLLALDGKQGGAALLRDETRVGLVEAAGTWELLDADTPAELAHMEAFLASP